MRVLIKIKTPKIEGALNYVLSLIKAISEDIRGICTRPYVIGLSGNLVYKVLRKRLVSGAVLLGTLFYLGNRAFNLDIRGLYIAIGTLSVAIAAFVAQKWGKWALKRSLLFAETHGANLLEHKKAKRFKTLYLPELYATVYGLEAKLMYTAQQLAEISKRHETLYRDFVVDRLRRYSTVTEIKSLLEREPDRFSTLERPVFSEDELTEIDPVFLDEGNRVRALLMDGALLDFGEYAVRSGEMVMSQSGFEAAVIYLLGRKDRQRDEMMEAGLDLSFLEDYLDGAPFHPGNTKIMEQAQHGLMKEIDGAIGRRPSGKNWRISCGVFSKKNGTPTSTHRFRPASAGCCTPSPGITAPAPWRWKMCSGRTQYPDNCSIVICWKSLRMSTSPRRSHAKSFSALRKDHIPFS